MALNKILVYGIGTMGSGIAYHLASRGKTVYVHNYRFTQSRIVRIESIADKHVKRGLIKRSDRDQIMERLIPTDYLGSIAGEFDLAIESTVEDLEVKKSVLHEIELASRTDSIIATNTSSLRLAELSEGLEKSERFVGLHFFNPPYKMELVEVSAPPQTDAKVFQQIEAFLNGIGRTGIRVTDSPGFVVNRLLITMINEASKLAGEGVASIDHIDMAMRLGANNPMGPLQLADFIGIDLCVTILESFENAYGSYYRASDQLRGMVKNGLLGRKSGKGFYSY